jgi:hypothetical protein
MMATLTSSYLLATGKRERKTSMRQPHYFPANANAAPDMRLEEIGVNTTSSGLIEPRTPIGDESALKERTWR